ncbi:hypothetical protein [Xenorhabdus littoralis]|uniref:hypothetical protein n=1 Tax=Xenorhabdus littoralis TaxID=2582835 RepID=UPI0029E800F7|nr:hypothetical protein [Xenorhabdus sp. psl]MDX7993206.1 hypothetical protein [Xenorhabdus sp. psl]
MVKLGNFFGRNTIKNLTEQHLKPGAVIFMKCNFTTPPKMKYLLVASCEPKFLVLVINSEINNFIRCREELLQCQVDIPAVDHPFLCHDSFVNCVDTYAAFNLSDIKSQIIDSYAEIYKGRLRDYCIRNVIEAVSESPSMEPRHMKMITGSLSSVLK